MGFLLPGHFIQSQPPPRSLRVRMAWRPIAGAQCLGGLGVTRMQPCSLLMLRHPQVAGSLTLTLLLLRGGANASGSGPQCSRSVGPAPARSALQAGRSRAPIPSACPLALPLAGSPARSPAAAEPGERARLCPARAPRPRPARSPLSTLAAEWGIQETGATPVLAAAPQHPFRLPGAPYLVLVRWLAAASGR